MAGAPRILESDDGDRSIHPPIVSGWIDVPEPATQNRAQKGSSSQERPTERGSGHAIVREVAPALSPSLRALSSGAPVQRQPATPVASETFAAQAKVRHPESTISRVTRPQPTGCPGRFTFRDSFMQRLAMCGYGVASRSW
ncbi:hypothetical protein XHC_4429 [Xanthomonas hortorum pv. carotae str. M081]|nr:hypothetical protein XHC_4429 [Xanthomonas hortorum pv. carotae str. M081]